MSQMEIFPADPPAQAIEHGGYHPASKHLYRGRQVPATYMDQHGMRTVQSPTLLWLLDDILDALYAGPVLRRELGQRIATVVEPATLSRHLHLLLDLGLVQMDYRFDEPRNAGRSDPAVIQLPKMGVS